MLELNYIVVPNNIEIGGEGLSQIFCGRLQGLSEKFGFFVSGALFFPKMLAGGGGEILMGGDILMQNIHIVRPLVHIHQKKKIAVLYAGT